MDGSSLATPRDPWCSATARSLEMVSIDALKSLGSVVFPPLIDLRHHHLPLPLNHTPTTASPHGTSGQPPHLRSLSHEHPWCSFASWGWCLAVVLSRTPIFASGAQHPPLTLVPRGGRAGLLRIPGRSVLLSGAHTTTLGV